MSWFFIFGFVKVNSATAILAIAMPTKKTTS
jgi:hypothetical protein